MTQTEPAPIPLPLAPPVGEPRRRVEDEALLTGRARYAGDLVADGLLHLRFLRSSIAHARIASIDVDEARTAPGVAAVLTADDLTLAPVIHPMLAAMIPEPFHRPALAQGTVRFVGEIIAVIVAESEAEAVDAAELVVIDLDPLDAIVDMTRAAETDAPRVFPDTNSNVVIGANLENGERPDVADDDLVSVELYTSPQRMAVAPMEPNAIVVDPNGPGGRLIVRASTQGPHGLRDFLARHLDEMLENIHVVCPAVGGAFGGKGPVEVEYLLVAATARRLGRPVRYAQTRAENLATMHGRGQQHRVVLEATRAGDFVSLRVDLLADGGAYPSSAAALMMTTRSLATGVYRIPHLSYDVRCVATNTAPIAAFRGAGRPEAAMLLERAVDILADDLGMDPVELRRRNLLRPDEFPYQSLTGAVYDSGDYGACLDEAVRLANLDALRAEQARRRDAGERTALGIGLAMYVEVSAGHESQRSEHAALTIDTSGRARVLVGTYSHGQGHATSFAQVVAARLGLRLEEVEVLDGDTDLVAAGTGTQGSRSMQIGGGAVLAAADAVLDQARILASDLLEASPDDIEVAPGMGVQVRGVPASALSWAELAKAAADQGRWPAFDGRLAAEPGFTQNGGTAPFGCHVAVVEVDLDTGRVRLDRMLAVDDCGVVINPLLVAGQVHGGLAAGIGQALFEETRYDDEGNPLTVGFADYAFPSAAELPSFETAHTVTPSPMNALGVKGVGEAGTTGSIAAVQNAVVDALSHLGVRHVDIPLSAERVWRAIAEHE